MNYIFGYGSLICPEGINDRQMKYIYTNNDLTIAKLKGYQRCWNASYDPRKLLIYRPPEFKNILFLGLAKSDCHFVNGIIFPINEEDMRPFLNSEGILESPALYVLENVTNLIDTPLTLKSEDRVFTCVTVKSETNGLIKPYYINGIREGLEVRGKEFKQEFINTTFPNMPKGYYDVGYTAYKRLKK